MTYEVWGIIGALIVGILFLAWSMYTVGKGRGEVNAEKKQLEQDARQKAEFEKAAEIEMQIYDTDSAQWKKYINSLDYSQLSDDDLNRLHQGKRIANVSTSSDTDPDVDPDPTH